MAEKGFERITEIVKHRHETGDYGNAHFEMNGDLLAALRASAPPQAPRPPFMSGTLGDLLAIPVLLVDLPAGSWRLVDNSTKEILFEGSVDG